jgi:hypothetical protein
MAVGLSITLFAMALDEWTSLGELELISGCAGLITSVIAAIMAACDMMGARERREELPRAIPASSGSKSEARRESGVGYMEPFGSRSSSAYSVFCGNRSSG